MLLDKLTASEINTLKLLLQELEEKVLLEDLNKIKIYYQINTDPRNPNNKALYVKTVLPKYKEHSKRKSIGVYFGSLKKHPEGWTNKNMLEAKDKLVAKAFNILTGK